jgi:hypothetical protein
MRVFRIAFEALAIVAFFTAVLLSFALVNH